MQATPQQRNTLEATLVRYYTRKRSVKFSWTRPQLAARRAGSWEGS
ncbi:unnamed protein product [Amoebophrya sp. A25]|nr:unnamed protein product [Amoebophrya sp. A25]|eukprot:GSA25T00019710001.1